MILQLLRHATLVLRLPGTCLLVDPMLGAAGSMEPVGGAGDDRRIPLVDLPLDAAALDGLIAELDGVLVTHLHRDHWDQAARDVLPKHLPLLCQPADAVALQEAGFRPVPVDATLAWRGLTLVRTGGRHGTGEIGSTMGPVSGFVLRHPAMPTLYVAGDTIWCPEVQDALDRWHPDVVVVNAGEARFSAGDPITMSAEDVLKVSAVAPAAEVVAVHFESVNHCRLTRAAMRAAAADRGLAHRVRVPEDGAVLTFPAPGH